MKQEKKECADCCGWATHGKDRCSFHQYKPAAPVQSEQLTQFYRSYAGWLDDGAKEGMVFYRNHGLCLNLCEWLATADMQDQLLGEIYDQFKDAGLCTVYPFNERDGFHREHREHTCYLNEARINWVRQHAE